MAGNPRDMRRLAIVPKFRSGERKVRYGKVDLQIVSIQISESMCQGSDKA